MLSAMIAWHAADWQAIIDRLGPSARRGDDLGRFQIHTNWDLGRRMVAEAHHQQGRPDSAAWCLALIVNEPRSPSGTRYKGWDSWLHYDLGRLYADAGQREQALEHYGHFLKMFTRPDSNVAWMREQAQQEIQRLAAER